MTFSALILERHDQADGSASIQELTTDQLPSGNVTVAVEYSTVDDKDGLCLQSNNPAGARYQTGDKVVLTGWRVGETHWGGYSQKARVKGRIVVDVNDFGNA